MSNKQITCYVAFFIVALSGGIKRKNGFNLKKNSLIERELEREKVKRKSKKKLGGWRIIEIS